MVPEDLVSWQEGMVMSGGLELLSWSMTQFAKLTVVVNDAERGPRTGVGYSQQVLLLSSLLSPADPSSKGSQPF